MAALATARALSRRSLTSLFRAAGVRYLSAPASEESTTQEKTTNQTHFGFETVAENEKEDKVYEVFHRVAETYDLMNDVMSGGIHRLWKDHFIQRLAPTEGTHLLDVAGGTGDIAFRFLEYIRHEVEMEDLEDLDISIPRDVTGGLYGAVDQNMGTDSSTDSDSESSDDEVKNKQTLVTVCDINHSMLQVGKGRARERGLTQGITWVQGNAESLPIADNSYDAYTIAFGIRNCTHVDKVLSEAYRVLRPGGRFVCLEFSQLNSEILQRVYDSYSFQVIPVMGQLVAGDWKSYQYLVESIRQFPDQEEFAAMIKDAGFRFVKYENLTLGVAAIHSGFKL